MSKHVADMRLVVPVIIAMSLTLVPFAVSTPADVGGGHPDCNPNLALENDQVKIWFQGHKGHIKVFDNNESTNSTGHYTYNTGSVDELDADGNVIASLDLGRAYPHTSSCTIEETEEFVNVTFTVTEDVQADHDVVGQATVTIDYNFNKSANGAKFDLLVEDWPWQGDGTLGYAFEVKAAGYTIEDAENGLGFRDEDGNSAGYIEWAPNATAYYDDGHNETALVDSTVDNDGTEADVFLEFTNVTAGYNELVYDPWVGVGDYIIVLGILIGLAPVEQNLPAALRPLYDVVSAVL